MLTTAEDKARLVARERRYRERFPGWRRKTARYLCPKTVAGKQCRRFSGRGPFQDWQCICRRYSCDPLDHAILWRTPDGDTVLTGEPYRIGPEVLADFKSECAELGLKVTVEQYSPYSPGRSFLVLVERDGPKPVRPKPKPSAAERRRMAKDRICWICREPCAEGEGVLWSRPKGMVHTGECSALLHRHLKDYSRSKRGKFRPVHEILRLVREERERKK